MRQQLTVLIAVALAISLAAPFVGAATAAGAGIQDSEAQCEYPLTMTDATGEEITIEEEPESVVTLYPGDAQLAYSIGAEDKVVGMPVGQYTESLDAGDRTDISEDDGTTPIAEEVVALDPDVVLAANVATYDQELLEQLEDAGITVVVLDPANSIDDVRENVRVTGEVTGECEGAEETIQWMNDRLEVFENALEDEEAPLAYYDSGNDGATFGSETFQHDVLTASGLENLAAEAGEEGWTTMNVESVVAEDPQWIVYPDRDDLDAPPNEESLQATTAAQEGNIIAVDDNQMSQPGPNVVYAIETLVENVHPDVYDEIESDLEEVDTEHGVIESENESEETNETDGENEGEDTVPGFGIPAGIAAALVAAGFLARRR